MLRFSIVARPGDEPGQEDEQLVERAADEDAFAELYRRHVALVYRYLLGFTGNPDEAADLTQHTFTRALERLPRYEGRGSFSAWLLRIARNAAIDAYRRRRRLLPWDLLSEQHELAAEQNVESIVTHHESLAALRVLVARLPAEKRDLLALRFGAGLTCREIGAVVGKSEEAVKKQIARIVHQLTEAYHERT
jgi:RNA polymerase sigma factor (sigma-70 family)